MKELKAHKLTREINKLYEELIKHQEKCKHPPTRVKKKHGGNTGNYDPTEDCYWTDFECEICLKKWRTYA